MVWLGLGLGVGCVSDPPAGERALEEPIELGEVEALLGLAVQEAIQIDTFDLQEAYLEIMALSDGGCPYGGSTEFWYDECETTDGAGFSGYVFQFEEDGDTTSWSLYGQADVHHRQRRVHLSGSAGWGSSEAEGITYLYSYVYGTFLDAQSDLDWLRSGQGLDLFVQASTGPEGHRALVVDGAVGGLGGDVGQAVDFRGTSLAEVGYPGVERAGVPDGSVGIRLSDGTWIDVSFEASDDGCGRATLGDEELGEVCVDLGDWLDWEVLPW